MDFTKERRIITAEQRMAKTGAFGVQCPMCIENLESFEITDANDTNDTIHVDGACPAEGYVSGWTRRTKA